jgi:hypothetical protein
MKNAGLTLILAILSLGTFAQYDHAQPQSKGEDGKQNTPQFKNQKMARAYHHYIALKDALVASDADKVDPHAEKLVASLTQLEAADGAKKSAKKVKKAASLEAQRKAFDQLSVEMRTLVEKATLSEGQVFVQFCPMAQGGQGAAWLANEKQINNPYFGDSMLRCGSVKETLQ